MTDQTETARALLWRHGLPEDVIDGALCLHAQELAAAIREETRQLKAHGVLEPDKYRPCRDAANQIDPTRKEDDVDPEEAAPAAPAAQAPATDQTAPSRRAGLRDEIAAALEAADYRMDMRRGDLADAVMPVLYREWPWLRAEAEELEQVRTENARMRHELEVMYGGAFDAPSADRAALCDRIAEALYERERPTGTRAWADAPAMTRDVFLAQADTVLAVLPAPADRTAVRAAVEQAVYEYRELTCQWDETDGSTQAIAERATRAALRALGLADEAQPATEVRCTCADAGAAFAPAGHYADCPAADGAQQDGAWS
ncbi:hypothetical protein ACIQXA_08580 [Streptomyces massasporeus]|uniref:hypothetical protein n=1 Tax=Streptomyces massasporeus TaxID=67324 RepID=UPI003811E26E